MSSTDHGTLLSMKPITSCFFSKKNALLDDRRHPAFVAAPSDRFLLPGAYLCLLRILQWLLLEVEATVKKFVVARNRALLLDQLFVFDHGWHEECFGGSLRGASRLG